MQGKGARREAHNYYESICQCCLFTSPQKNMNMPYIWWVWAPMEGEHQLRASRAQGATRVSRKEVG